MNAIQVLTPVVNRSSLPTLILGAAFAVITIPSLPEQAQTFTVIHSFTGGADGANPRAGLSLDGAGNFYDTTLAGGTGAGCFFEQMGTSRAGSRFGKGGHHATRKTTLQVDNGPGDHCWFAIGDERMGSGPGEPAA